MTVKPAVHYILTTIWGLLTPALMTWGSSKVSEWIKPDDEQLYSDGTDKIYRIDL